MLRDNKVIWVLEYVFGGLLVAVSLSALVFWPGSQLDMRIWTSELFAACLGVILISCASSMRQRMILAKSIEQRIRQIADQRK